MTIDSKVKALSISALSKAYADGTKALDSIDLTVDQGDFFALLGPNGAGKSTTIGVITSLINKTSGQVSILGYDIDKNLNQAKSHIGVVPQEFNFNMFEKVGHIVQEQAGYYGLKPKISKQRAEKYLKHLGLWHKRDQQSRMLSGGMKRRLMIARALVHEPKVLILDEPTAGVDIELRRSMWDYLIKLNQQGTTIILTTHYLEEAENLCKNLAIIDQGKIVENTTMKSLLSKINKETFILDCKKPLNASLSLPGYELKVIDESSIEVSIDNHQALNILFARLSQHNVEVLSMRNKSNRLEELFISLVNS